MDDASLIAAETIDEINLAGRSIAFAQMLAEAYKPGLSIATKAAILDRHAAWATAIVHDTNFGVKPMRPACDLKPGVTVVPKPYYVIQLGFKTDLVDEIFWRDGNWFARLRSYGVVAAYQVTDIVQLAADAA